MVLVVVDSQPRFDQYAKRYLPHVMGKFETGTPALMEKYRSFMMRVLHEICNDERVCDVEMWEDVLGYMNIRYTEKETGKKYCIKTE